MKIGVISDTHGLLDPKVPKLFDGVEHILHGGDIGPYSIITELERIAPVTAVLGNNDFDLSVRELEIVTLAGRKFLLHHIVDPRASAGGFHELVARQAPDIVVFGHTHKPFAEQRDGTFWFNPGYAGRPRFNLSRSVALLHCDAAGVRHQFISL
jgi:putative phosphoesterase